MPHSSSAYPFGKNKQIFTKKLSIVLNNTYQNFINARVSSQELLNEIFNVILPPTTIIRRSFPYPSKCRYTFFPDSTKSKRGIEAISCLLHPHSLATDRSRRASTSTWAQGLCCVCQVHMFYLVNTLVHSCLRECTRVG